MMSCNHYYFLLSSSSLAVLNSLALFNILWSLLLFMKFGSLLSLSFSLVGVITSGMLWWVIYSSEMNMKGLFNLSLESGVKTSMILFIMSEVFFFSSFFWSYFHYSLSPSIEGMFMWPPYLIEMFDFDKLPLVNTLVLLTSGVSVTLSHMFMISGKKFFKEMFLLITLVLGFIFSTFQAMEYMEAFFSINDGSFGSSFFILTGFHGLHVVVGSLFLTYVLLSSLMFASRISNFMSFELSSWYWHFVDVIWIFLFYFVYYKNFL